uniref:PPUP9598 n=1 Tax=Poeciliopsis prolifica TaxID=188132 RepID=A0A0S7EIU7_9TELE
MQQTNIEEVVLTGSWVCMMLSCFMTETTDMCSSAVKQVDQAVRDYFAERKMKLKLDLLTTEFKCVFWKCVLFLLCMSMCIQVLTYHIFCLYFKSISTKSGDL